MLCGSLNIRKNICVARRFGWKPAHACRSQTEGKQDFAEASAEAPARAPAIEQTYKHRRILIFPLCPAPTPQDKSGNSHWAVSAEWQNQRWKQTPFAIVRQSVPARRATDGNSHWDCSADRKRSGSAHHLLECGIQCLREEPRMATRIGFAQQNGGSEVDADTICKSAAFSAHALGRPLGESV